MQPIQSVTISTPILQVKKNRHGPNKVLHRAKKCWSRHEERIKLAGSLIGQTAQTGIATLKCLGGVVNHLSLTSNHEWLLKAKEFFNQIKVIGVISLVFLPITCYNTGYAVTEAGIITFKAIRHGNFKPAIDSALEAISSVGELLEEPERVMNVLQVFYHIAEASWTAVLSTVATVFSGAVIIHTIRQRKETGKFQKELLRESSGALVKQLHQLMNKPGSDPDYLKAFAHLDTTSLEFELEKTLALFNTPRKRKQFLKATERLKKQLFKLDPQLLKDMEVVSQKAYLECIHSRDKAFLQKHVGLKGKKIKSALDMLMKSQQPNETQHIAEFQRLIEKSIRKKRKADKRKIISNIFNVAAGTILLPLEFGVTCSPLAPVGLGILAGVGFFCLSRTIADYKYKQRREKEISHLKKQL